uniref:Rhodanese domain-containing protein n=1 Tax=Anopheles farauti TaxID=69004 RepID=A0A182QJV5_9DIPT
MITYKAKHIDPRSYSVKLYSLRLSCRTFCRKTSAIMLPKTSVALAVRSLRFRNGVHFSRAGYCSRHVLENAWKIDSTLPSNNAPQHMLSLFGKARTFATTASTKDGCGGNRFAPGCIEPQLVATIADIEDLPNHPEKLLIDVREPSELAATGQIPTSINIPLKTVQTELSLSPEAFEAKYGRKKPDTTDPIIFSCRSGVRAGQAALEADNLGFKKHSPDSYLNGSPL